MTPKPTDEELEQRVKLLEAELLTLQQKADATGHDVAERNRLERERSHRHDLMRYVIWHANAAVAIHDRDLKYICVSENYLKQYKVKENDVIGRHHYDVFPDLPQKWRDVHQRVLAGAVEGKDEDIYIRADGSVEWTRWTCRPWYESDGSIGGLILDAEVITDRKRAEEALRQSEERFRALYENAPMAYQSLDAEGRFLDVNPAWLQLLGYERDEVIGAWFGDFLHPEFKPKFQENFPKFKQRGVIKGIQFQMRHKNGHDLYVEFNGCIGYEPDGSVRQTYCVFQDITERKRVEEDLRNSEATLRGILDNLQDAYFRADLSGRFTLVNRTASRMYGYGEEELIGMPAHLLYANPEDRDRVLKGLKSAGQLRDFIVQGRRKEGSTFWVSMNVQFIRDGQGAITGTEGVSRDLTERKRAEEQQAKLEAQLQQAQRIESVGRLAGGVAHDFNNMLGVILGHAEAVLEQVDPAQPIHAALTEILKAAGRSADLTRQLLAFGRRQAISPKVIDMNEAVEGILKMLRRLIGEDIQLAWLPGVNLWPVKIDPSQIDQILTNLSVNARDAIAGVGKVTIETGNVAFDEAYCADHGGVVAGEYTLLAVSDDGCGMDQETLSHLFEPFFTTKGAGKGTGLGLATVYGIVTQNSGFINVHSEPGQGTTIKVYLPRHKGHAGQAEPERSRGQATGGHETVLIVEDEPALLNLTEIILKKQGYRVLTANTPGEAIGLAQEHAGEIHLLITDVIMPEMNGRDLAKALLSLYPNMKRLFMSGYTADVIAHHGVLDDGVHFIQKPFSRTDLAAKVLEALERQ